MSTHVAKQITTVVLGPTTLNMYVPKNTVAVVMKPTTLYMHTAKAIVAVVMKPLVAPPPASGRRQFQAQFIIKP